MEITGTIIVILAAICSANAFSKYGRSCKDIGCLPSETCIMTEDSCSYYQEKNKDCGAYPTCKKVASINHSPGPDSASGHNVQPKPYAPPPSSNSGGQNVPGYNPSPSAPNPDYNPSGGNRGNNIYPSLPNNGNNDPYSNRNNGNYDPYPNRGSYDPSPSNNRGGSYPTDPYGSRGNGYGNRDDDRNRGSSSGDSGSGSGSTLNGILNFFRNNGGGGSSTRYGTPSSSGSGLSYGDIFNALSNVGNRGGSSSGGSGLSDILNSFGIRGSGGSGYSGNNNYDDRRQQPSPNTGGSSNNGGFISSLSSIFGQQLVNSLIQNAITGNRGGNTGGNNGGSGLINSLRYGGLFNENNGHSATDDNKPKVTVSGAGPGGYPTQAPYHPPNNNYNNQPIQSQNYNTNNKAASQNAAQTPQPTQSGSKPAYGWSV